jgi:hypothetical protein
MPPVAVKCKDTKDIHILSSAPVAVKWLRRWHSGDDTKKIKPAAFMGYSKHKTGVNKYDPVLTYC